MKNSKNINEFGRLNRLYEMEDGRIVDLDMLYEDTNNFIHTISIDFKNRLEAQYLRALVDIICNERTTIVVDRTGTGVLYGGDRTFTTRKLHWYYLEGVDCAQFANVGIAIDSVDSVQLIGKNVHPALGFKEMLWFMLGKNDQESLNKLGVHYWDKFFREDGTIGKSYGTQFRGNGDQLLNLIKGLVENPESRRHIINLWNVEDLNDMALPPCFYGYQFNANPFLVDVEDNQVVRANYTLDLTVSSRSADMFLGVPYNFLSSAFLHNAVYELVGGRSNDSYAGLGSITWNISNAHIYLDHIDACIEYIWNTMELYKQLYHAEKVLNYPVRRGSYKELFKTLTIEDFKNVTKETINEKLQGLYDAFVNDEGIIKGKSVSEFFGFPSKTIKAPLSV